MFFGERKYRVLQELNSPTGVREIILEGRNRGVYKAMFEPREERWILSHRHKRGVTRTRFHDYEVSATNDMVFL